MAQGRTAKGTASSKSNGTSLTISGVALDAGSTLIVGIAWEDGGQNDKPSLKWGNRDLRYVKDSESTRGDTVVRLYKARIKVSKTKDITATWTNAKNARAMFATQITDASKKDVQNTNSQGGGGTSKNTGSSVTTTVAATIHISAFANLGPTTDTLGTAGAGHTLGQRAGTSGGGAGSNIDLVETYEILTATGSTRSTYTQVTGRPCASTIVAFRAVETYTVFEADHIPWKVSAVSNRVLFKLEDSSQNHVMDVELPVSVFEILTDAQVTEFLRSACLWYTDVTESENDLEAPDPAIETRLSSFVNDEIVV